MSIDVERPPTNTQWSSQYIQLLCVQQHAVTILREKINFLTIISILQNLFRLGTLVVLAFSIYSSIKWFFGTKKQFSFQAVTIFLQMKLIQQQKKLDLFEYHKWDPSLPFSDCNTTGEWGGGGEFVRKEKKNLEYWGLLVLCQYVVRVVCVKV